MAANSSTKKSPARDTSRAVIRPIEAGCQAECPFCGERVKFRARHRDDQIICNVYEDGAWQRVEQYHADCYIEAKKPHGVAQKSEPRKRGKKPTKQ